MPSDTPDPRRNFLKAAASTGLAALSSSALAQSFFAASREFEWLPTECADERYPMQLISGDLHSSDGVIARVPSGKIINNGWGEIGSRRLVGSPQKPVPERLDLKWFSFSEDKFFAGTVPLPRASLTQLFADGFEEPLTNARVTWSKIIVGMGLGGWTSVWLAGSGIVKEISIARLEPVQLNWALVLDNPAIERSEFVRSKLLARVGEAGADALAKHGPPVSTWPRYAQRYRWRIAVEGDHQPLHMFLRTFNGERQFYDFSRSPPGTLESAPKHAQITWLGKSGSKLLSEIRFDETEIYGALDKAGAGDSGSSPMKLRVEFGARSQISVTLESRAIRIPLTRSSVTVGKLAK